VDPKAEAFYGWSGYNSNLDNPILNKDPEGDICLPCLMLAGAVISAGVEYAFQVGGNVAEKGFTKEALVPSSIVDIGISFAAGGTGAGMLASVEKSAATRLIGFGLNRAIDFTVGTGESAAKQASEKGFENIDMSKAAADGVIDLLAGGHADSGAKMLKTDLGVSELPQKFEAVFSTVAEVNSNTGQKIKDSGTKQTTPTKPKTLPTKPIGYQRTPMPIENSNY